MAEIIINKNDIMTIVESYRNEDPSFVVRNFIGNENKKRCRFYIHGKECAIDFFIKKNSINILPACKNKDECNALIEYITKKGFLIDVQNKQFVITCTKAIVDSLLEFVQEECIGIIECNQNNNIYKFTGYNGDVVTFTFYSSTNKAMIQGKPFQAFGIITTFLSETSELSLDEVIALNSTFAGTNTPTSVIRSELQNRINKAYLFLDEALLKSISGSLTLLKQRASCEDYSGCLAGCFKALEGYLGKILIYKYNYTLKRRDKFGMFYIDKSTRKAEIDENGAVSNECRIELKKLYSIYCNKRNVYLHSTVEPSQTRVIETLTEAKDIADDILNAINESYKIIFV